MTGRLLVLEGIDGCGKTTQMDFLSGWLPNSGLMPKRAKLFLTREPGGTDLGVALRDLLLHPPGEVAPEPLAELLMYAADRAQHVSQKILPAISNGDWVLSDRFSGSTLAYQGYGRQLDIKIIESLERIATRELIPDITILLDLSVKKSLLRRKTIANDRIEAEGVEFLERVAKGFLEIADNRNWIQIDADQSSSAVNHAISSELSKFFC